MAASTRRRNAKPTEFGQRLRKIRESAEIDPTDLSRVVGRSRTVVYQIEVGLIQNPSAALALELANALGTDLDYLLNGQGKEPSAAAVKRAFKKASQPAA